MKLENRKDFTATGFDFGIFVFFQKWADVPKIGFLSVFGKLCHLLYAGSKLKWKIFWFSISCANPSSGKVLGDKLFAKMVLPDQTARFFDHQYL